MLEICKECKEFINPYTFNEFLENLIYLYIIMH